MLEKIHRSIQTRGLKKFLTTGTLDLFNILNTHLVERRDNKTQYVFINKSSGKNKLVVILAGYKKYLWPATLERIRTYVPHDHDVCITSSGIKSSELIKLCMKNGWSYLCTQRNSPGVALNKAISLHPSADYIFKLDEDIFISSNFFTSLPLGYQRVMTEMMLEPGFCAPVLNVNGISYKTFLQTLRIEDEYKKKFGELIARCDDLPVHDKPEAAWWIWKNSLPFDSVSQKFIDNSGKYYICSTRFSIGAILFRRNFWETIKGFKSSWYEGVLGVDEDVLCRDCVSFSRPMCIINSVLAGHFSFYPQESFMKAKLPEMAQIDPETFPPEIFSAHHS